MVIPSLLLSQPAGPLKGLSNPLVWGDPLVADDCWQLPREERQALEENEKAACLCLGPNIFVTCGTVPGILTEDFYDDEAKSALGQAGPSKPIEPTSLPSPTPIPSPTPHAFPNGLSNAYFTTQEPGYAGLYG